MLFFSNHARLRIAQRGIPLDTIDFIDRFGEEIELQDGKLAIVMSRRARRAAAKAGVAIPEAARSLAIVVAFATEVLVTAIRVDADAFIRSLKKRRRGAWQ